MTNIAHPFAKSQDHDRAETTWGLQNTSTFTCYVLVCFGEVFYESCQSYLFISQYCGRHNVRLFLICALKSTCLNGSTRSSQYSKTNPAFIHTLDQPQPPFYTPLPLPVRTLLPRATTHVKDYLSDRAQQ